uniref:NADH-ubiquinone oxidoreductase chain 3 n=9 Tax=Ceratocystis TaxID=5157 RepID=M1F4R0_9PEZI|nr:NADH dehydrogenase subunit 3 [Ceratocystis cacaofunesta]YP_009704181.1 NADH dehydrogenase subunit 3 [Ceratocystis fimbriata]YP_009710333.1 NADH dehydrogenase subunit 3 [Ceratocystis albifundus]YP_010119581.1 NADH dehydrogenase subunit 1 [Ceratocystis changhui]YP_010119595.1 NADH dehydrogenase subunit 1 [Ceratocystis uchidae]YP_010119609.1 NADH dehydrogenase subunit 1 [Ceratocystis huliohia]YP_010119623.1 NADH dehydrogenase subunit 1 [Ceratocystis lukuohia]YP_010119637.1 NADH dehydrogenase
MIKYGSHIGLYTCNFIVSSLTILLIIIAIIAVLFLVLNFLLAPHNPYQEKESAFECGFHSFLQSRSPFNVTFFVYGILYLIFDLEIILLYPYAVSMYENDIYGLIVVIIFTCIISIGFIYEIGKNALKIASRQDKSFNFNSKVSSGPSHIYYLD